MAGTQHLREPPRVAAEPLGVGLRRLRAVPRPAGRPPRGGIRPGSPGVPPPATPRRPAALRFHTIGSWTLLLLVALLAVAAALGAGLPVATAEARCYTFTLLKVPEGAHGSWAVGVNNRGQVVGQVLTSRGGMRAALWEGDEVHELGTLSGPWTSSASAINDQGHVVGWSQIGSPEAVTGLRAFLYRDGRMLDLGSGGRRLSAATAINASGTVVGYTEGTDGTHHAVAWRDGVMHDLGVGLSPLAINRAGQVVGRRVGAIGSAFLWEGGQLRDLLPPGSNWSAAHGINDAGQVIVAGGQGFIWDGTWTLRFEPSPEWRFIYPRAINNVGQVVGESRLDGGTFRGILWDANGDRHDLAELTCGASAEWWSLRPMSINDAGQIVGTAERGVTSRAFLLSPPR
jgi:probable HAF family extracellular repeat protein